MRFLTIRAKVTLWYTAFMLVLVTIMLGVLMVISDTKVLTNYKQQLVEVVDDVIEDIQEGDSIDYFEDGVFILEYNAKGEYINGSIPSGFSPHLTLKDRRVQEVKEEDYIFYTYDQKIVTNYGQSIWIRGVITGVEGNQLNSIIVGAAFVLLPILVILSSMMGYLITKRAFEPVRHIQETAQKITDSKELSMRIGLPKGKDEISKLGQTIDGMLEQLERSFEKEKQFTSDASHELRTPLAVILNESEYGMQHLEDVEEAKESMEIINRQANKMTRLINQLLFLARADADTIELQYEEVDIGATLNEMIEERTGLDSSPCITFKNEIQGESKYLVDRMLFYRAVQNVLQNAIIYGVSKQDKENTESKSDVQLRLYEKGPYFVVEVKDYGMGISSQELERIWDRFYQVDKARSRQKSGSMGLGLSMVKWIIQKHHGYVQVESKLNEGSTFSLYFPNKKAK